MYKEDIAYLVRSLGEAVGDPTIELDEENYCETQLNERTVSFLYEPENEALLIKVTVAPADTLDLEHLLRKNHFWGETGGGMFCLHPNENMVYSFMRLSFPLSNEPIYPTFLCDILPNLLGAAEAAPELKELSVSAIKQNALPFVDPLQFA